MCVDPLLFHICTESYWGGGVRGGVCVGEGGRGVGVMHALGQNRCRKEKKNQKNISKVSLQSSFCGVYMYEEIGGVGA